MFKKCLLSPERIILEVFKLIYLCAYSVVVAFFTEYASNTILSDTLKWIYSHPVQFNLEICFIFLIMLIFYFISGRIYVAAIAVSLIFVLCSMSNYFKIAIRNEPFYPWDLLLVKQMGDGIKTTFDFTLSAFVSIAFLILSSALHIATIKFKKSIALPLLIRIAGTAGVVIGLVVFTKATFINSDYLFNKNITIESWAQVDTYKNNGFVTAFVNNLKQFSIKSPTLYSKENINEIVNSITPSPKSDIKPNIICIQDESFMDIMELKNVDFGRDLTPNLTKLQNTSMWGHIFTPQFGGGTANTEFEVLTGFSLANLPAGSTPFEQFVKNPVPTYMDFLKENGYHATAIHSFIPTFWKRDKVYPLFGFDNFIYDKKFTDTTYKRGYIDDMSTMKEIIRDYEQNKKTGPYFNFTVTMQNHFAYHLDDYDPSYRVNIDKGNIDKDVYGSLVTYATGIRDADAALGYIMDYFDKVSEPTIIVFYGDHLGSIGNISESYIPLGYADTDTKLEDKVKFHTPPFAVYTNYSTVKRDPVTISAYELLPYVTEQLGLDRPMFYDYLNTQSNYYSGVSLGIYIKKDGTIIQSLDKDAEKLSKNHALLQYDLLFGSNYAKDKLFALK